MQRLLPKRLTALFLASFSVSGLAIFLAWIASEDAHEPAPLGTEIVSAAPILKPEKTAAQPQAVTGRGVEALDLLAARARDVVPRLERALDDFTRDASLKAEAGADEVPPIVPAALEAPGESHAAAPAPEPYWKSPLDLVPFESVPIEASESEGTKVAVVPPAPSELAKPRDPAVPADYLVGVDLAGQRHPLAGLPDVEAAVVVFLGIDCDESNRIVPQLNRMADAYRRKQVPFFAVLVDATRAAVEAWHSSNVLTFPLLFDGTGELRRRLEPSHVPHAFLVGRDGEVAYSGRIDDPPTEGPLKLTGRQHYLADAIRSVIKHEPVQSPSSEPSGTKLASLVSVISWSEVTYAEHIEPLLQAHCADCHNAALDAPFALLSYENAREHASAILEATESRMMPPKGNKASAVVAGRRALSDQEILLIARWVAEGTPRGERQPVPVPPLAIEDAAAAVEPQD